HAPHRLLYLDDDSVKSYETVLDPVEKIKIYEKRALSPEGTDDEKLILVMLLALRVTSGAKDRELLEKTRVWNERILQRDPRWLSPLAFRAFCRALDGEVELVQDDLNRLMTYHPLCNTFVDYTLAIAEEKGGHHTEARAHLDKAL